MLYDIFVNFIKQIGEMRIAQVLLRFAGQLYRSTSLSCYLRIST